MAPLVKTAQSEKRSIGPRFSPNSDGAIAGVGRRRLRRGIGKAVFAP